MPAKHSSFSHLILPSLLLLPTLIHSIILPPGRHTTLRTIPDIIPPTHTSGTSSSTITAAPYLPLPLSLPLLHRDNTTPTETIPIDPDALASSYPAYIKPRYCQLSGCFFSALDEYGYPIWDEGTASCGFCTAGFTPPPAMAHKTRPMTSTVTVDPPERSTVTVTVDPPEETKSCEAMTPKATIMVAVTTTDTFIVTSTQVVLVTSITTEVVQTTSVDQAYAIKTGWTTQTEEITETQVVPQTTLLTQTITATATQVAGGANEGSGGNGGSNGNGGSGTTTPSGCSRAGFTIADKGAAWVGKECMDDDTYDENKPCRRIGTTDAGVPLWSGPGCRQRA